MKPVWPVRNTRFPRQNPWSSPREPSSLPHLPGGLSRTPQGIELGLVPKSVHGLPEAAVLVGHQLAFTGEGFQRFALEHRGVPLDEVEDARLEDEEAGVDPSAVPLRLLLEPADPSVLREIEGAESPAWLGGTDRRLLPVARWKATSFRMSMSDTPSP